MSLSILFIADGITPFTIGGMQRHSSNLVKSLLGEDVRLTLAFTVNVNESIPDKEKVFKALNITDQTNKKFQYRVFKFEATDRLPGHYIRSSKKMSKTIAESFLSELDSFDVIYCKGLLAWEFVRLKEVGRVDTPIVVNLHGYEMFQESPNIKVKLQHIFLLRGMTRRIVNGADYVVSYGAKITDLLKSLGLNKIIEIPSGVSDDWIISDVNESLENKIEIVFMGRYERRKGIEEIQDMIISYNDELKDNFDFHFIGPIPKDKEIKADNVIYHGEIRDVNMIRSKLDQMDVLLCPSYSEGMPNVILESMARGLAVIATDVGAVSLLVNESNGAILASPAPKLIYNAISRLTKENINKMKLNSLKKIQAFRWSEIAKETVNKLKEVANDSD